ncbi:glycoside hydrolase N-terminal domain-containing protein [Streptomyces antibioticus]|uniref:glycoside hydrolase N-terminal domain-containing protein n=1 Tax=Streptomyces antibioticus TaxID=1890 RepID=UPI0036C9A37F
MGAAGVAGRPGVGDPRHAEPRRTLRRPRREPDLPVHQQHGLPCLPAHVHPRRVLRRLPDRGGGPGGQDVRHAPQRTFVDYRRALDFGRGVHTTWFGAPGRRVLREAFASRAVDVMVFRYTSETDGDSPERSP